MQSVRDAAKKSEKYLIKLEQSYFVANAQEYESMKDLFSKHNVLCEDCINKLMSGQGSQNITNSEQLLDKMLNFQDQLQTALGILQTVTLEQDRTKFLTV